MGLFLIACLAAIPSFPMSLGLTWLLFVWFQVPAEAVIGMVPQAAFVLGSLLVLCMVHALATHRRAFDRIAFVLSLVPFLLVGIGMFRNMGSLPLDLILWYAYRDAKITVILVATSLLALLVQWAMFRWDWIRYREPVRSR